MPRPKKRPTDASQQQHYRQANELPEDRRRAYESILEDFDKQGEVTPAGSQVVL